MNKKNLFLAASAGALLLGAAVQSASAQDIRYGTRRRPVEGRRYETMRALAHYLDQNAQTALQSMQDQARAQQSRPGYGHGDPSRLRRLVPPMRDFARQADLFHRMLDDYQGTGKTRPDVASRVTDLANRARRLNSRLRAGPAATISTTEPWSGDWENVLDVLKRMNALISGQDVQVPVARGGFEDYDRDYGPFRDTQGGVSRTGDTGRYGAALSGSQLEQFRRLAHELDTNALRTHQVAETNMTNAPRQREFLADLRRFAERARDVHQRADANEVYPREVGPIVNDLVRDARETQGSLRSTRVFPEVWDQWARTIDVMARMAELVRY